MVAYWNLERNPKAFTRDTVIGAKRKYSTATTTQQSKLSLLEENSSQGNPLCLVQSRVWCLSYSLNNLSPDETHQNGIRSFIKNGLTLPSHAASVLPSSWNPFAIVRSKSNIFVSLALDKGDVHAALHSEALNRASVNFARRPGASNALGQKLMKSRLRSMTSDH